ncbi:hypothetical protein NQ317_008889 [Molorchus minor]|uniref:Uncharacterized protein n=1 Tax=Molorchus minor TaxID=1323400 RepID=A0ABQ9JL34_9CUCU|nr:hypothetical protein NQ317_008889 [Molorchus minor]
MKMKAQETNFENVCQCPRKLPDEDNSVYSSCESSESDFHSAKTSLDGGSEEDQYEKRYSIDLETAERRHTFAQRLKDALRQELSNSTDSSSSRIKLCSWHICDRVRSSGPRHKFEDVVQQDLLYKEDSLDEDFLQNSLQQERKWIDKFKSKQSALSRKESNKSSEYSFSTEYSSELEEVYEQFSRWLENPLLETEKETKRELDARELAVVRFAGRRSQYYILLKNKLVLNAKSLSLELARQKHRLAAQLSCEQIEPIFEKENVSPSLTNHVISSDAFCQNNKHRAWFISCVNEAVIQTLEEVCVKLSLPQSEKVTCEKIVQGFKSKRVVTDIFTKVKRWFKTGIDRKLGLRFFTKGRRPTKGDNSVARGKCCWCASSNILQCGHQQLVKLDTVSRILIDRKWTVRELAEATLRYSSQVLQGKELSGTLLRS